MRKSKLSPRIVLPLIGSVGLVAYVTAPCWLANSLVDRLDLFAFGFAILIALPWLAACLEEFEIGGLKAKLRSVEERTEAANETAFRAREIADELAMSKGTAERELQAENLSQPSENTAPTDNDASELIKKMNFLSEQYVKVRESSLPGTARTAKMTEIFGQLESVTKNIPAEHKIADLLSREEAGDQLAAVAWLRSHPDRIKPVELVKAFEQSKQSFVQYWVLRVLEGYVAQSGSTKFSHLDLVKLQQIEKEMHRKTDRWYLLHRINNRLKNQY